jgi:hypothetical protein
VGLRYVSHTCVKDVQKLISGISVIYDWSII